MNLLAPFGMLYGRMMDVRNRMYDRGLLRSYTLGARTISIGNLTTGGTGKTPLVALTARILAESGERVGILTRGYGRADERARVLVSDRESMLVDASTGGDEPVELARKLLGKAIVIADADRVAAARWAKERFCITAFVLDDAFQHRRAQRDLDVVCIDATDPCGNGRILPAGTLREPFRELRRADIIVVTRADLVESVDSITERLKLRNPDAAVFEMTTPVRSVTQLERFADGRPAPKHFDPWHNGSFPLVFSGLGNPENFRRQLQAGQLGPAEFRTFPDHHRYTQRDIDALEKQAESLGAGSLVTTAKDAVKLAGLRTKLPVFVVEIEAEINDEEGFRRLLLTTKTVEP